MLYDSRGIRIHNGEERHGGEYSRSRKPRDHIFKQAQEAETDWKCGKKLYEF